MTTTQSKSYCSYVILDNQNSYPVNDNEDHNQYYNSESFSRHLQNQESNSDVSFIRRGRTNESLLSPKKIFLWMMILILL